MSTSKKASSKSKKSPAPATKSSSAKPSARSSKAIVPATTTAIQVAPQPVPAPLPLRPVASRVVRTMIGARVDVGFGNALFLRGEGPGLSWERGLAMECVAADLWRIELPESARGYAFKFLINDVAWCTGPDYTAAEGASVTYSPTF